MRSCRAFLRLPRGLGRAAALLLAACAPAMHISCIGGTGTDTDNGVTVSKDNGPLSGSTGTAARVVDSDGRPLAGVLLTLHTPDFRPDSSAAQELVVDAARSISLASDSLGYVRFDLLNPGKYVVEGRLAGVSLFFDTLAVADVKALAAYTFRSRSTAAVKGHVRLSSGLRVDSGRVFIRGTSRFARLDTAGAYDLGVLPVDVGYMAIGLTYRASVREARIAEQKSVAPADTAKVGVGAIRDTLKSVFTCREVAVDSAARVGATPISKDLTGPNGMSTAPSFASADTVRLDTAKVAAVARSCDSLSGGTVVAVRTPPSGTTGEALKRDSLTTNLIAVSPAGAAGVSLVSFLDSRMGPVLVPLNGCVSLPGTLNTTYDVKLITSAIGSDLLVGDVADKCLVK